eukprot:jgi/Tetstr1/454008/TSEL_040927.t1
MDVEALVRGVRRALADTRQPPEAWVRRVRDLDPEVRAMVQGAVEHAMGVAKTMDAEGTVTVVATSPRDVQRSVTDACACVASPGDAAAGAFAHVTVAELAACRALRTAGFTPRRGKRYAVKAQRLDVPTTTGRIQGIGVQGTALSVAISSWKREADIATRAGELGVGPEVHAAFVCRHRDPLDGGRAWRVGIIIMDALSGSVLRLRGPARTRARKQVAGLLETLHSHGILHGDAHEGNAMVDDSGRVFIIDYGFATLVPALAANDLSDVRDRPVNFDAARATEIMTARLMQMRVVRPPPPGKDKDKDKDKDGRGPGTSRGRGSPSRPRASGPTEALRTPRPGDRDAGSKRAAAR